MPRTVEQATCRWAGGTLCTAAVASLILIGMTSVTLADPPVLPGAPIEDPTGHALDALRMRLRRRGEQNLVRIVHLGDSHIAADILTGAVRHELQTRFGDGGPGMVLPGTPWPHYRHDGLRSGGSGFRCVRITRAQPEDGPIGLSGAVLYAEEPGASAWLELDPDAPTGARASSIEVHYLRDPQGGRMQLKVDDQVRAQISTAGNRVEAAFFRLEIDDGTHRIELVATGGGTIRITGLSLHRSSGLVYDALGINGARLTHWRRADADLLAAELGRHPPALLITTFGTNEVDDDETTAEQHRAQFLEAFAVLRAAAPTASCLAMGPPDRAARTVIRRRRVWQTVSGLSGIISASRQAALESGCAFWDTYTAMGGRGSIRRWVLARPPFAADDHIHLTSSGYRLIAQQFAAALLESL